MNVTRDLNVYGNITISNGSINLTNNGNANFAGHITWYYPNKIPDARKKIFTMDKQSMVPIGSYFKNNTVHIVIRYGKGEIENLGRIAIFDKKAMQKAETENFTLVRSSSPYFDLDFIVKETKSAILINNGRHILH